MVSKVGQSLPQRTSHLEGTFMFSVMSLHLRSLVLMPYQWLPAGQPLMPFEESNRHLLPSTSCFVCLFVCFLLSLTLDYELLSPPIKASAAKTFKEHLLNNEWSTWKLSQSFVFKYHVHTVIFIIFVVLTGKLTSLSGLAQYLRK